MLKNFLFVGLGGALGSMLRYAFTLLAQWLSVSSHWATLTVNILGSFLIGCFTVNCGRVPLLLLLTVGFCGGFTTFSTFSSQSLSLLQNGRYGAGFAYIVANLLLCILFAWLGFSVAKPSAS